jgi:hypothetical protein
MYTPKHLINLMEELKEENTILKKELDKKSFIISVQNQQLKNKDNKIELQRVDIESGKKLIALYEATIESTRHY